MRGSHAIWQHPGTGHAVPVPHHGTAPIAQGTLISIFNACGIPKPRR
ncbi:MAG: type II toxin-antitoxin system HicA family toxin [Kiritimatiellae bacterium]|nr:type II toxin-antitoxin system HicA family toxin [Kiritimatiellia bacterium]